MAFKHPSDRPTLVIFPTPMERERFAALGSLDGGEIEPQVVGFGPVASAARTGQLLAGLRPARVLLIGIAGSFASERLAVGSAHFFGSVALDGVGVGCGSRLKLPSELGFPQWHGTEESSAVEERLPLALPGFASGELLTVCAASLDAGEREARLARFPNAQAEDMEGFAVAMACHLAAVPLAILRGISNTVGLRGAANWDIDAALAACRPLAQQALLSPSWTPQA